MKCSLGLVTTVTIIVTGVLLLLTFQVAQQDFQAGQDLKEKVIYEAYDPLTDCVTPFEKILGYVDNVPVFSNCNRLLETELVGYVSVRDPEDVRRPFDFSEVGRVMTADIYTSMEFVIRWMIWTHGVSCHGQRRVAEMWGQNYFYNPMHTSRQYAADYIDNYMTAVSMDQRKYVAPRRGDVIIYEHGVESHHGHAAVVVRVTEDRDAVSSMEELRELRSQRIHPRKLYVAEQNWDNTDMGGKNYTRVVSFRWRKDPLGNYEGYVVDDHIPLRVIGRMRVGKMQPIEDDHNRYVQGMTEHVNPPN